MQTKSFFDFVSGGILGALSHIMVELFERVLGIIAITFINLVASAFIWAAWSYVIAPEFGLFPVRFIIVWLGLTGIDLAFRTVR